jgi:hypothetical protein
MLVMLHTSCSVDQHVVHVVKDAREVTKYVGEDTMKDLRGRGHTEA